jgi:hypothetical protein
MGSAYRAAAAASLGSSQQPTDAKEHTMSASEEKYWFNLRTGLVERGFESPSVDRAGPFDSAEEAARALEVIAARTRAWAEEEAREERWGGDTDATDDDDDAAR